MMQLGLHICDFNYPGGPAETGVTLAKIARAAEDAEFESITVMDHLFQIAMVGPHPDPMLEAYTTLGYLAGVTTRVNLGAMVTSAVYRPPGLMVKAVTALDVLSGGRAFLGLGAAWNEQESVALGLPFPSTAERFERLEEVLQIARQMWSPDDGPFEGKHYKLGATINSPQAVRQPHPPIVIGGSGEKKTLRLVAKYADACNIFAGPQAAHKLAVLREHCEREGRDYDEISKTTMLSFDTSDPEALLGQLRDLHDLGFTVAHGILKRSDDFEAIATLGEVIGQTSTW
ncbi:MAG TPA: LLM class F420-dependent oxidoreductase [Jatrophihabitans sp.]|jgi:alkanesulfonate monooxygenase